MNKNKLFKTIEKLRENIAKAYPTNTPASYLYVRSWVIGGLNMLESKARGIRASVYPYGATYRHILNNLEGYFFLVNCSESIKEEAKQKLHTPENISLIYELKRIIEK